MMRKKILSVAIAVAMGIPAVSAMAEAKNDDAVAETVIVEPERIVTPEQADMISGYAAKALLHIAQARSAIQSKDRPAIDKELGEARAYLELVKAKRPTAKVIDEIDIAKAHLDYEEMDTVADDLVPIEADLTVIGELVPVEQARQNMEKVKQAVKKGDKAAAKAALVDVEDSLIYTELDLPIASTERYVADAQSYVAQGKYKLADKALDAAEAGVVFLSVDMESPIAEARDSIIMAKSDYAAKRYDAAENDLVMAKKWLEAAREDVDQNSVAVNSFETINQLEGDIDKIAVSVKKHDDTATGAIEGALHKLKAMAETEAEKASIGWKKKRPDSDVRADLIEAKQHVAFAENMQFYAKSDPADIFEALDHAKAALDKAAASGQLDEAASSELGQVKQELTTIRENPDQRSVYSRIRSQLSSLIDGKY